MGRIKICKETGCKDAATTAGFCRLHYLKNWKKIKESKRKRAAKKLNNYIESICRKHPDRYMEIIKKDLRERKFDRDLVESFGGSSDAAEPSLFEEPTYDEDVEKLIRELKIEKGY